MSPPTGAGFLDRGNVKRIYARQAILHKQFLVEFLSQLVRQLQGAGRGRKGVKLDYSVEKQMSNDRVGAWRDVHAALTRAMSTTSSTVRWAALPSSISPPITPPGKAKQGRRVEPENLT